MLQSGRCILYYKYIFISYFTARYGISRPTPPPPPLNSHSVLIPILNTASSQHDRENGYFFRWPWFCSVSLRTKDIYITLGVPTIAFTVFIIPNI